jgi:hypothetical protein
MSDTTTPNYGFDLPTVGASQDTWGGKLNANWVAADSAIHTLASGYLPVTGGIVAGNLQVNGTLGVSGTLNAAGNVVAGGALTAGAATIGSGGLTVNGNAGITGTVNAAAGAFTGTLTGNTATFSGQVSASSFNSTSGTFSVAPNYYLGRSTSDGAWRFVEGGTTNATIDTSGNITVRGNLYGTIIQATGAVQARGGQTFMGAGGTGVAFQFSPSWYLDFNATTGTLQYVTTGGNFFVARTSDFLFFNNIGQIGGHGAYADISDARSKSSIEDSALGLDAVLRLRPVSFQRTRRDADTRPPRTELGFVAQEVAEVIPEAVQAIGMELHDGSGGHDSDQPSLALTTTAIIAALVNAVKELTERVASLEIQRA